MTPFPLSLEPVEAFSAVREFFRSVSFDETTLCRELGMDAIGDLIGANWDRLSSSALSPALNMCLSVFVRGQRTPAARLRTTWGDGVVDALGKLGLLRPAKHQPDEMVCPAWVYPVDGCVVASDRRDDPDGDPLVAADDVVFPAIYGGTLRFLRLIPDARGGDALDMCGGTGIGAFRLSRSARSAATSDLTPRSARFAEFNAKLNHVPVESLCGDLYVPAGARTFDLITAHPPFVPSLGQHMVFRDGGETGEEVTRGVVAGLSSHLRPGGRCMILCVARDATDGPFEERVCAWLGDSRDEFDVVFALEKTLDVGDVVEAMCRRRESLGLEEARRVYDRLMSLGTRRFVYGVLHIERFATPRRVKPLRVTVTPQAGANDFEPLLRSRRRRREADFARRLAASRPRLADGLELTARHVARDGDLVPADFVFSREGPVGASLRLDGWVVPLIARMSGHVTVEDVLQAALAESETPAGFSIEPFVELVAALVDKGFLEVSLPD